MADTLAIHQDSGSCSAQPGCGVESCRGVTAPASTSPDCATRIAFTPLVPTSIPRKQDAATLAGSEQDLHRELIELLVLIAFRARAVEVEGLRLELPCVLRAERLG